MTTLMTARLYGAGIPLACGVYLALVGFRVVGRKPGESGSYDAWHARWGNIFQILGPLVALIGVFMAAEPLSALCSRGHWRVEPFPYMPLSVGTAWEYRDAGGARVTYRVARHERIQGAMVARLELDRPGSALMVEHLHPREDGLYRCRKGVRTHDGEECLLKVPPTEGREWMLESEGGSLRVLSRIAGLGAAEVPAGRYAEAVRVETTTEVGGRKQVHTTWFVSGVGIVRMETEEGGRKGIAELERMVR